MKEHERGFFILSLLGRSLSHKLRTPLSVISNDLCYFRSLLPENEVERSLRKVKEMSSMLEPLHASGSAEFDQQTVSVLHLMTRLKEKGIELVSSTNVPPALMLQIDEQKFLLTFDMLIKLLSSISPTTSFRLHVRQTDSALIFSCALAQELIPQDIQLGEKFDGCCEFFSSALGLDALEPPIIDALMWGQRAQFQVNTQPELQCDLCFSLEGST